MSQSAASVLASAVADVTAVFSDIDGTIAHYAKTLARLGYERVGVPPSTWLEDCKQYADEIDALLWACYPASYREARFAGIPVQFWRHNDSGRILKTFELYNLSLDGAVISENTILLMELLQCPGLLYHSINSGKDADVELASQIRQPVLCCLITGARTSTFTRRRQGGSLPQVAYEACEGGSKLWCRLRSPSKWFIDSARLAFGECASEDNVTFFPPRSIDVPMDVAWTNSFSSVTGFRADKGPEENRCLRKGRRTIWDLETELNASGFATDHEQYDTSFLVDIRKSPCLCANYHEPANKPLKYPRIFDDAEDAEDFVVTRFRETFSDLYGVELFVNLGKGQVNAKGSGKRGVMLHVLASATSAEARARGGGTGRKRFCAESAVALFDDENDLQFAELCGAGILPSVAHEKVLSHSQWSEGSGKHKWFRPPVDGLLGSEWALKQIVLFKRQQVLSSHCDKK